MKRTLIILLLVMIFAGGLGTLIANDPGYVFVAYRDYSLQTSLWVMLGMALVMLLLVYQGARLVRLLLGSPRHYRNWRTGKKADRASRLTLKGLRLLLEGEHERARRYLDTGAEDSLAKGINYLAAARAADDVGDDEARERYFRLSEEVDPSLHRARQMTIATLALRRGDYALSLEALAGLTPNKLLLNLKQEALSQLDDWRGMLALVPALSRTDQSAALAYEKQAIARGFEEEKHQDADLTRSFKSLSRAARECPEVILAYSEALSSKETVEPLVRQAIHHEWNPQLLELYASLDSVAVKLRMKTAEKWLKDHADDAALHYCLGCIYEQAGDKDRARDYYAKSIVEGVSVSPSVKVSAHKKLANLLALEGDLVRSNEHLRKALEQTRL